MKSLVDKDQQGFFVFYEKRRCIKLKAFQFAFKVTYQLSTPGLISILISIQF